MSAYLGIAVYLPKNKQGMYIFVELHLLHLLFTACFCVANFAKLIPSIPTTNHPPGNVYLASAYLVSIFDHSKHSEHKLAHQNLVGC